MNNEVTLDDFDKIVERLHKIGGMAQPYESSYAVVSGWDPAEFARLYKIYIESTQADLRTTDNNTTKVKGDPLEDIARYFLEKGGIVRNLQPGGRPNRWQVDGIGETYPQRLDKILGRGLAEKCGPQAYMEAKNHNDPMGPEDWAQHCRRMQTHGCKFGISFSTGGYGFKAGQGYAGELYHEWLTGTVHILFSVVDLRRVAVEQEFPWAVLKTAYLRQCNESYELTDIQNTYAKKACLELAKAEHLRLAALPMAAHEAPLARPSRPSEQGEAPPTGSGKETTP